MDSIRLPLLMLHFIGLAMGVGGSLSLIALRKASHELAPTERVSFMLRALVVSKMGSLGFVLLLLTGLGMFFLEGPLNVLHSGGPAFHAKLTLVVIMTGVLGYSQVLAKRAREANGGPAMAKLPAIGNALAALGVCIIIAAVIAFQ